MFDYLQIYDRRERWLVGAFDAALAVCGPILGLAGRRKSERPPARILLLRLERIGDLLMTVDAIDAVRRRAPEAEIHLVVGSWNKAVAELLSSVNTVETLDAPWLARGAGGDRPASVLKRARSWRGRRFDLAVNFEPDVRSNALVGRSRAARRVGFSSGGGSAFLTDSIRYDPSSHVAANARRIVDLALPPVSGGEETASFPRLSLPGAIREQAAGLLRTPTNGRVLVGVHASGGRAVKQWPVDRLAAVAARLAREHHATIVLTGTLDDRPLVDALSSALPQDVPRIDVAGAIELPVLAGVLERLDLFVTADTGPMHLAAAVGTPVVGIFGPSDPVRYGPLTDRRRIVTVDLWCRPCNRVRKPPERCTGRVPDCLNLVETDAVYEAAVDLLNAP